MLVWQELFELTDVKHRKSQPTNHLSVINIPAATKLGLSIQQKNFIWGKFNRGATPSTNYLQLRKTAKAEGTATLSSKKQ